MIEKIKFCERTSISLWESMHEEYKNNQNYCFLTNKPIIGSEPINGIFYIDYIQIELRYFKSVAIFYYLKI